MLLHEYFSTIGSDIANTIPTVNNSFQQYLNKPICHSFILYPTSPLEIEEISKLNNSKSAGPFSIPTKLFKMIKLSILSVPLAYLFNCSFSCGTVPDKLKLARVVPIYKNRYAMRTCG